MDMQSETVSKSEFDALIKETRSFRRIFGVTIILIIVVLIYTLPAVIENTSFRSQRILELQGQQDNTDATVSDTPSDTATATTTTP